MSAKAHGKMVYVFKIILKQSVIKFKIICISLRSLKSEADLCLQVIFNLIILSAMHLLLHISKIQTITFLINTPGIKYMECTVLPLFSNFHR